MDKIKTLSELGKICHRLKKEGKTIGLITGCFDILHIGHIELFRFAKKSADIVIVGLDNDETIKLSKGDGRPIHNSKQRAVVLSELASIDYVFCIQEVVKFDSERAEEVYAEIVRMIRPNYLVTNPKADRFWKKKQVRAKKIGVILLKANGNKNTSTTRIIQKLEKEF